MNAMADNDVGTGRGLMYEIPADMRYEERVFWVFTLKQLFIFGAFAAVGLLFFTRTNYDVRLRLFLTGACAVTGFVFATFTPLQEEVEQRIRFLWTPKYLNWTQPHMRSQFIRVKQVQGTTAVLQDGRMLSMLLVNPIDFSVLSDEQKMVILAGYRAFLNSLSFPIQIFARTTRLNLREYFTHAKNRARSEGNQGAIADIEAFEEFVEDYVARKGVHDRLFYIVIPQEPCASEEETRKQLANKTSVCKEKLSSAGLTCTELDEQRIVSLYASFFGTHVETNAEYLSLISLLHLAEEEREHWHKARNVLREENKDVGETTNKEGTHNVASSHQRDSKTRKR